MTAVTLACPYCAGTIQVDSSMGGQQVACPLCHHLLMLPPPEVLAPHLQQHYQQPMQPQFQQPQHTFSPPPQPYQQPQQYHQPQPQPTFPNLYQAPQPSMPPGMGPQPTFPQQSFPQQNYPQPSMPPGFGP